MKRSSRAALGVAAALAAGQVQAQPSVRAEAPAPWTPRGELHFLALPYGDTGWFVDPASVSRDGQAVEARLLVVEGATRRIHEGRVRHSWHVVRADCAARQWATLAQDAYDADGVWLAGYTGPLTPPSAPTVDHEHRMMAYLCQDARPADLRAEPTTAAAIQSVLDAVQPPAAQAPPPSPESDLVLARVDRFALFVDRASMERQDQAVTLRALQIAPEGFQAGSRLYAGGWSGWRFDCAARTGDRLDFAAVAENGVEGPVTPETGPARAIDASGDMTALFEIACGDPERGPATQAASASSLAQAVSLGRARLAAASRPPAD